MAHSHAHDHGHSHGNYYLDQLCTIAACGALGGVCVMMYLDGRLSYILTPFFFYPVLIGGAALLVMACVRAVTLWREAGKQAAANQHHHDHDHAHVHDHVHEHDHAQDHDHAHEHGESCDDGCGHDHEHGWTPARYAVLMLPIALYFLNLPNSTFSADAYGKMMSADQVEGSMATVASKDGVVYGFKEIANAAYDPGTRQAMQGKTGKVKGMYGPLDNDRQFRLYRVKMTCCAADAIPIPILIASEENITRIAPKEWVEVEGQIKFLKLRGQDKFVPVIHLTSASQVKPTAPLSDYSFE